MDELVYADRHEDVGKLCQMLRTFVPCRKGYGFVYRPAISFLPAKSCFSNSSGELCSGTPQMSKDCKSKVLLLVYIDFLPSKYMSGCKSCGLSQ